MDSESTFDDTSDSSFEIISRSSIQTSDDESRVDGSESVASLGDAHTDDASSAADAEGNSEDDQSLTTPVQTRADIKMEEQLTSPSLANSSIEAFPSAATLEPINNYVKFIEPANNMLGSDIEVTHIVRSLPGDPSQTLTIKQTMSSRSLKLDRPFRILYCGDPSIKDDIIEKIAQAIAASPAQAASDRSNSSRLNIIPMSSFGKENPSPDVMLIPSTGLEIIVDDCTGFSRTSWLSTDANELFFVGVPCLAADEELGKEKLRPEYERFVKYRKPDLAIVTHGKVDREGPTKRRSGDIARLGVPVIDICDDSFSHLNPVTTPQFSPSCIQAVHQCLEIRSYNDVDYKTVVRRIPIDLPSFLGIDSIQLNRNLACLIGMHDSRCHTAKQKLTQMMVSLGAFFTVLLVNLLEYLQAAVLHWRTLHCEVREFITARFDLIRPTVLSWERIRYLVIPLAITGTHLYMLASTSAGFSGYASLQNQSSTVRAPSTKIVSPSVLGRYTYTPACPTALVAVTHTARTKFTVTETSTLTRFEAMPTYRSLPQRASSATLSFPLLTSQEGKLLLTMPEKLPRLWQPSQDFVQVFEDQKHVNVSLTKISNRTYEMHRQVIDGCKPFVVNVQSIQDPMAHRTYSLPPVKECSFYSVAKVATNKARLVLNESTSRISSGAQHLAEWSSILLRKSSNRVYDLVEKIQTSTHIRADKVKNGSSKSISPLAKSPSGLVTNSASRLQELMMCMRRSTVTYTNDMVTFARSRILSAIQSQHVRNKRIAKFITEELKNGKGAFQDGMRNMHVGINAFSTELARNVTRKPLAVIQAKSLKTARSRAFAIVGNIQQKEAELERTVRKSRWQIAAQARKASDITVSEVENKVRGPHKSHKVAELEKWRPGRLSFLWKPFARHA